MQAFQRVLETSNTSYNIVIFCFEFFLIIFQETGCMAFHVLCIGPLLYEKVKHQLCYSQWFSQLPALFVDDITTRGVTSHSYRFSWLQ